jgi:CMP/dCMP kinase
MSNEQVIAIDGPAASGKSTIAKILANKLSYTYLSSGLLYRAITYMCYNHKITKDHFEEIEKILKTNKVTINKGTVFINDNDANKFMYLPDVDKEVAGYSSLHIVREHVKRKLREISKIEAIVMDGRDIGTVIFPNAKYKFFVTASPEVRAKRRYLDFLKNTPNNDIKLETILQDLIIRDKIDSTRELSPLQKAPDAIVIDTSELTIEQTMEKIYNYFT